MAFSFGKKYGNDKLFTITPIPGNYVDLAYIFDTYGDSTICRIRGLYENRFSQFDNHAAGETSPMAYIDVPEETYVNLPKHMINLIRDIRADKEAVMAINNLLCGFQVYAYNDTKHGAPKTCYGARMVDIDSNCNEVK